MKKVALGVVATAALIGTPALAADLPPQAAPIYKVPETAPPVWSWTGLYLGVAGGWGFGRESFTDNSVGGIPPGTAINDRPDGGIFGGVLGYRYQAGAFVFGVEGTAAWADLADSVSPGAFATDGFKIRSLYSATGQAGWAFNQALLYVKGGWAASSVNASISSTIGGFASQTQTDSGWTVGAGFDYAVWQNLILGVEYDHFDLGYAAFQTTGILGNTYIVRNPSRLTVEQAVGRLTYKFNLF
jgi:outer membrane immunogenic protein